MVEILVTMVLLSIIVLALMTVFNSTQKAFRSSLTQTDVLESGRLAMGLMVGDLEGMTPSLSPSNAIVNSFPNNTEQQRQFCCGGDHLCFAPIAAVSIVDWRQ